MENAKVDNMDIERTKELFAYEMTEVILRLKGEFAAVSGKDTRYASLAVDQQKLQIAPVTIAQVEQTASAVAVPEIKLPETACIPEANLTAVEITVPQLPSISPVCIQTPPIETKLDPAAVQDLQQPKVPMIPKVDIAHPKMPDVPLMQMELKLTPLAPVDPEAICVKMPSFPEDISGSANDICAAIQKPVVCKQFNGITEIRKISVPEIPKVALSVITPAAVAVPKVSVISAKPIAVSCETVKYTDLPSCPTVKIDPVEVEAVAVAIPALAQVPQAQPVRVTLAAKPVAVPAVPDVCLPVKTGFKPLAENASVRCALPVMPDVTAWEEEILSSVY